MMRSGRPPARLTNGHSSSDWPQAEWWGMSSPRIQWRGGRPRRRSMRPKFWQGAPCAGPREMSGSQVTRGRAPEPPRVSPASKMGAATMPASAPERGPPCRRPYAGASELIGHLSAPIRRCGQSTAEINNGAPVSRFDGQFFSANA
ncbi:hypothetical protein DAEQUDRAFT_372427 [Daedalea quercina L-15889]|uniref:Uncharacterized protein n=1 Tax=Daedalea quercina L-15889 TaxID=1314783 RepID=A0A165P657_9APHY|nr:hypothetical protein DAEQUDRAFT_372427 [Daedalea quercina L-15889]